MFGQKEADKIKIDLYRLHFLLTEPESDEMKKEGLKQFKICHKAVLSFLASYLAAEFKVKTRSDLDVLTTSFEKKLFTEDMTLSLKEMIRDFKSLNSLKNRDEIYLKIKNNYAHNLQLIYDMLIRMGEDPVEEKEI